jgi:hypothetical protein
MAIHISIHNSAIYAAPCACRWHPLEQFDFQRPIDIGHVGNIQNSLVKYKDMSVSIIKTITIINDTAHNRLYIFDGQHRYRALQNECALGNHICFVVQQVPGNYEIAYQLYTASGAQVIPQTADETLFIYQAKAYLRGLDMRTNGIRRPSVNVDSLFLAYQKTPHPKTITAFKAWIEDRNLKIKEAVSRLPQKTIGGPKLGTTTLARCQQHKYWFGLYQPEEYDLIDILT